MSPFVVREPEQLDVLASPLRQEILGAAAELGPCSISDLARQLGRPADALYYHVRKLARAGLLVSEGKRRGSRRDEEIFGAPGGAIRVAYDLDDPRSVEAIRRAAAALLRVAQRDFERGTRHAGAKTRGRDRNLRSGRATAWLSRDQLRELNALLDRIDALLVRTPPAPGKRLCAFSFVLAPVPEGRS